MNCKVNDNCSEMKPTLCIFQLDLNLSKNIGLSENSIQLNLSKSKSIKILVFNRTNKDVWLEKELQNEIQKLFRQSFQLKLRSFKSIKKPLKSIKRNILITKIAKTITNFYQVQTYPIYQIIREKLLVEECEVFSKDENDIGFIENLKLKLNFKDDTVFLFTTTPKNS